MDQEINGYFMINPDLVGNRQGLKNYLLFFHVHFWVHGVMFNKEIGGFLFYFHILVFQYFIKRESTFKTFKYFLYYFYHFTIFFQVHNLLS